MRFLAPAAISISLAAGLAGCSLLTWDDPDRCPQRYELGCARVEGRVLSSAGQPVAGATVALLPPEGLLDASYTHEPVRTGADGRFRVQTGRTTGLPAAEARDTGTMRLIAGLPGLSSDPIPQTRVHVLVRFAPPGERPVAARQDVTLPVP